ncbi:MAG: integrase core domain-containing protein [Alphaproteobacteria bacterium]
MSCTASCRNNVLRESFCGILKTELVHRRDCPERNAARRDLFAHAECYYNWQRIHSAFGHITRSRQTR